MVKVLEEVGPNVCKITFSADGSWDTVMESDNAIEKPENKTTNSGEDGPLQSVDILDLTQIDDAMDDDATCETGDKKCSQVVQQSSPQVDDDFWSGIFMSTFGLGSSNAGSNAQSPGISVDTSNYVASPPILSHSFHSNTVAASMPQSATSLPNTSQLQQHQFGNPSITYEHVRLPSLPMHVPRTPVAVQTPTSVLQQSSTNSANTFTPSIVSASSQASPAAPNTTHSTLPNPSRLSQVSSSPLHQHLGMRQNRPMLPVRQPQQNVVRQPNQVPNAYRFSNGRRYSNQLMMNPRVSQTAGQSIEAANRAVQMALGMPRIPSYLMNPDGRSIPSPTEQRGGVGTTSQPATANDSSDNQNWRPAGRMRGALSGQAYADAFNQFVVGPNQQAQAARSIPNVPSNIPVQQQTVMAEQVAQGTPEPAYSSAGPASRPVGLNTLPDGSPRMH